MYDDYGYGGDVNIYDDCDGDNICFFYMNIKLT